MWKTAVSGSGFMVYLWGSVGRLSRVESAYYCTFRWKDEKASIYDAYAS